MTTPASATLTDAPTRPSSFTRVLVGVDGGSSGEDGLALALALSGSDAELVLAYVWPHGAGVAASVVGTEHPEHAGRELLRRERLALTPEQDLRCRTALRAASSPAAGLHQLAEELACDLLVIASGADEQTGQVVLHARARAALHGAPCAIAVAPRGYAAAAHRIARVGFGYEETAGATTTMEHARQVAAALDAELHVMHVVSPLPRVWLGEPVAYVAALDDLSGENERRARARMQSIPGCVPHVCRGNPARRLREFSQTVDLLVLGSRSYGPVRRMLIGSVADEVLRGASCPVLVLVRADAALERVL